MIPGAEKEEERFMPYIPDTHEPTPQELEYKKAIQTLVEPIAPYGNIMELGMQTLAQFGQPYGKDYIAVLTDCLGALSEMRTQAEIDSGHDYHEETGAFLPIAEIREMFEYGEIYTTDDFIYAVRNGKFTDYDGDGEFVAGDGSTTLQIRVDVEWLCAFRDEWPYIAWYNR